MLDVYVYYPRSTTLNQGRQIVGVHPLVRYADRDMARRDAGEQPATPTRAGTGAGASAKQAEAGRTDGGGQRPDDEPSRTPESGDRVDTFA